MIEHYLRSTYQDGGRGPSAFDCYGLVRAVRHELFKLPLLPVYGAISPDDKRSMTHICKREAQELKACKPVPAAIATAWRGKVCLHVGVCVEIDGRLGVLETGRKCGPRWQSLRDFERHYLEVIYYHDA
jgi:hypothetical protein